MKILIDPKKATSAQRLAVLTQITEGMRDLNPDLVDAAEASVRRNMASAKRFTPHIFVRAN